MSDLPEIEIPSSHKAVQQNMRLADQLAEKIISGQWTERDVYNYLTKVIGYRTITADRFKEMIAFRVSKNHNVLKDITPKKSTTKELTRIGKLPQPTNEEVQATTQSEDVRTEIVIEDESESGEIYGEIYGSS